MGPDRTRAEALKSIETKKRPSGEGLGRNLDNTISPIADPAKPSQTKHEQTWFPFRVATPKCSNEPFKTCS
jgi:hypothetical protein